ncbi:MAG: Panacea domain-containing protein [Thermodesulfobacteriota bacterium]|nr:Panacea domain-containing protein [Thermodesulfobacteriota bacterium]
MLSFNFNEQKAIAAVLYVSKHLTVQQDIRITPDFHKIFKILYFADQQHLAKYGRPIVGDYYIAMTHGPVPSRIYDMLKIVKGDSIFGDDKNYGAFFDVKNHYVYPKQDPDMDEFSESDIKCINESLKENEALGFRSLKDKSHDMAYLKATKDDKISISEMAKVAGADEGMLSYIRNVSENESALNA